MSTIETEVQEIQPEVEAAKPAAPASAEVVVKNPATGEVVGRLPAATPADVAAAAARGRAVQPAWEELGWEGRAAIMRKASRWVLDNLDLVIETVVKENGKTWEDAQVSDALYAANCLDFWASKTAKKYVADQKVKTSSPLLAGKRLYTRYAPYGLVGVIGPWNYPFVNGFGDCVPALMAGNSVILKPAEATPLTSVLIVDALKECGMPEGVMQLVNGKGSILGPALIDEVDMVMFTGSTEVGKTVATQAAGRLIPCCLELGGKDPFIVLEDANIDRAANHALHYAMFNGGQTCISVERVYVEEAIYDRFVDRVEQKLKEIRVGVPTAPSVVDVGAITTESQCELIAEHVEDARAKGARVLQNITPAEAKALGGNFYPPTVIVNADHTMLCMTEETFGPTLPIMKVKDAEEAIKMANDSQYGLMASVFTNDIAKGEAVAKRIQAGSVNVNDSLVSYSALELPMGGLKESGLGARHGAPGIRKYCRSQAVLVSRFHLNKDPHTMVNTGTGYKVIRGVLKATTGLKNRKK